MRGSLRRIVGVGQARTLIRDGGKSNAIATIGTNRVVIASIAA